MAGRMPARGRATRRRSARAEKQHRNANAMLHTACRRSQKQVSQETVAVGAHGDKIAAALLYPFHDFTGGVTKGQFGFGRNACRLKFSLHRLEVSGVVAN